MSHALAFGEIAPLLPLIVRKTAHTDWAAKARADVARAAAEILPDDGEPLSFFEIDTIDALIAVAAFMNSTGTKEKVRGTFFFALPSDLIEQLKLELQKTPAASDCFDVRERHLDLKVSREQAVQIVQAVLDRNLYNYRVPAKQVVIAWDELTAKGCREYAGGPCSCCEGAA